MIPPLNHNDPFQAASEVPDHHLAPVIINTMLTIVEATYLLGLPIPRTLKDKYYREPDVPSLMGHRTSQSYEHYYHAVMYLTGLTSQWLTLKGEPHGVVKSGALQLLINNCQVMQERQQCK